MYRWAKNTFAPGLSYAEVNQLAAQAPVGSEGLRILPFGNGAERMLSNKFTGANFSNIDLNLHTAAHIFRAVHEGIACAFRYGVDIMRENGMSPTIIRAGRANLFLSDVFAQSFVNATGIPVELYENDGSVGAALGAGIGAAIFASAAQAFSQMKPVQLIAPSTTLFEPVYQEWKQLLTDQLKSAI